MKRTLTLLLLLTVGIAAALFIAFHNSTPPEALSYDDDQEGLKDQIVFKFSHVVAENTPKGLAVNKFAELVYEKSNGDIKIEVFPNGSLYSDIEEINALKEGQVHFIAPSTSKLGMVSPKWGVLDLPFAFPDHKAIQAGLNGKIGDQLLQSLEKDGLKGLAHWTNGFKQITSNKRPVYSPDDLKGQSLRIMQSKVIQAQYDLLDADAHQDSFNSTYQLLEAGQVDGEENTISNIYSKKFYNVQKHLTISNHGYLGYAVMMDQQVWKRQSEKTQQILLEAMEETTAWNERHSIKLNEEQLELIKQHSSIEIHELTETQKQEWINKLDPVYDDLAPYIGKELVEDIKKLRKQYEADGT
ncbi:TRAP transporter substrate-binding protein [Bacillus canaveralius]|uniref:TRAP transporter substrate-binding protein n=1 Tax=Bacillus canaveralius TaxID=1403243 RepID=UPI000F78F111|nr:TRAP transporter substrate-binding protein [Bacillus canaveralius]RSK45284.1 DctP family TRAP transporter solute-binding subunit [Bacillus canaveralius]